jgi:hypothetical protein
MNGDTRISLAIKSAEPCSATTGTSSEMAIAFALPALESVKSSVKCKLISGNPV